MKYTLIAEETNTPYSGYCGRKNTVEFECDDLPTILSMVEDFLKGNGFHLDGYLDVVPIEEYSNDDTNEDDIFIGNPIEYNLDQGAAQPIVWPFDNMNSSDIQLDVFSTTEAAEFPWQNTSDNDTIAISIRSDSHEETTKESLAKIEEGMNKSLNVVKCPVCKLTKVQMQGTTCFDSNCGLGLNNKAKNEGYYQ